MDAGNGSLGREPARAVTRPGPLGIVGGPGPDGGTGQRRSPFDRDGRLARVLPFAVVAAVAEASLALPPGPQSATGLAVSLVLLAATAGAVFLPWGWLPRWLAVGVPLIYLVSVLGLTVASGGFNSGVDLMLLVPVVWTALFHRPWESAVVVTALAGAGFVASLFPGEAPPAIIARRVLFLTAVAVMISVAAHILRAQVRRSEAATARLQGRLRELSITADRDRIASSLHDTVVQRLFTAGLSLQGAGQLTGEPELRRRIDAVVQNLDDAITLLRQSIFGLGHGLPVRGLRRGILDVSNELTPLLGMVPEVVLDGPIDTAVPPPLGAQLLTALREALAQSGRGAHATRVSVTVAAGPDTVCLTIADDGVGWAARAAGDGPRLHTLRDLAERMGGTLRTRPADGGEELVWQVPLPPAEPARGGQADQLPAHGTPGPGTARREIPGRERAERKAAGREPGQRDAAGRPGQRPQP
ncbi:MAG: sensor histidine kinase [Gemmatimonadota bacterium]